MPIYYWLVDFFGSHSRHTVFNGRARVLDQPLILSQQAIRPLNTDNTFIKSADDRYLVIPVAKVSTRAAEINNTVARAAQNNLRPNKSKSKEILFGNSRRRKLKTLLPPFPDITWESSRSSALHAATTYRHQTTSGPSPTELVWLSIFLEMTAKIC